MTIEKIYSVIKSKNIESGTAHIVTAGRQFIEAEVYAGLIVNINSRTFSREKIFECLLTGEGNQIDVSPGQVHLEVVQPETIERLFHWSARFVLNPDDVSPQRLLQMLRIMERLAGSGDGSAAFDAMADEIFGRYKRFSLESATIKKRIDDFSNEFMIAVLSLNSQQLPSNKHDMPGWVFSSVSIPDCLFKDILLYFLFFGEMFQPVFRTMVKKEAGFGAKVGYARISKAVYNAASKGNAVMIFKGAAEMGALKLNWHSENKTGVMITQSDLDRLSLKDGDTVSLVCTN
jgi:hypothetical protein